MTYLPRIALTLCLGALTAGLVACDAYADSTTSQPDKPLSQSIKESYNDLKDSVTQAFGGYTGNEADDSQAYMEHYRNDLKEYHDSIREARDDYRRARLSEQKSYLEHHRSLPMNEDIDSDVTQTSW